MFIELRIDTDAFRARLRARAKTLAIERTTPLTLPDGTTPLPLPGCGGNEVWLDRIDIWEGTILGRNDDGSLAVKQPIDLFVVSTPTLVQNGAAPSSPCWHGTIVVVFRLSSEDLDGVPRLCMSFERFDPGTGVPAQITDFLTTALAEEAGNLAGACEGVDIAVLDAMFDGDPPPITTLTLALSSNSARMGLRIDFDVNALGLNSAAAVSLAATQDQQRASFTNATFLADAAAEPWTMMVHASLLTSGIRRQLRAGIEAEAQLDLVAGPSATFKIDSQHRPRIETSVEVQVIDACLCFSADVDLNVELISKVYFTLPAPNVLETRMEVEFDLDDMEVFCCSLTSSVLWPIVGDALWLENEDFGEEYAGGLVAHVFLPFVLAIVVMGLAHSSAEGMIAAPDDDWEKLDESDDRIVFRRRWNVELGDVGFGEMSATKLSGTNHTPSGAVGIVLSGTLDPAFEAPDAKLDMQVDEEFAISFDDPCGESRPVCTWWARLGSTASDGSAKTPVPLQVFDVRLIEDTDPLNQYGPYLMRHGLTVEFRVPFNKIKQTYKNAPYRPQLLVITSGGVRIVQVPELLTLTEAELEQTNAIHEMWQVVNCRDWALSDAFWSGSRYNPIWTVDPGPDDEIHQYWETVVEGLAASEAVAIDDLAGRRLAIIEPTAKGGLAGYTVLATAGVKGPIGLSLVKANGPGAGSPIVATSAGTPKPLRIARANMAAEAARLRRLIEAGGLVGSKRRPNGKQRLIVRQAALEPVAVIRTGATVRDVAVAQAAGDVELAVADARGVTLYRIVRRAAPILRRIARIGVARIVNWNGVWYTVGDGGLRALDGARATEARTDERDRGVVDADVDGDLLYSLDEQGVWSRRARFQAVERVAVVRGTAIAVHHKTFAVLQADGVQVFARTRHGEARPIAIAKLRGPRAIRAVRGPADSYRVELATGGGVIVSATASAVSVTARMPEVPRIEIAGRAGDIAALVGSDRHTVHVSRIGRTTTLRRESGATV